MSDFFLERRATLKSNKAKASVSNKCGEFVAHKHAASSNVQGCVSFFNLAQAFHTRMYMVVMTTLIQIHAAAAAAAAAEQTEVHTHTSIVFMMHTFVHTSKCHRWR